MESPLRPPTDPGFRLIETFLWTPRDGIRRRARHLARLGRTATRLGIVPQGVEEALEALVGDGPMRVRLTVDISGRADIVHHPFSPLPEDAVWHFALAAPRLDAADPWLDVKTTERTLYDKTRASLTGPLDEMVFLNDRGQVCEGTITNVFADFGHGLVTPPRRCGLLPGILREEMIETGEAKEAPLFPADIRKARTVYLGNSLRGLIRAEELRDYSAA